MSDCGPCDNVVRRLTIDNVALMAENERLRRLLATMATDYAEPLALVLDRDGARWCAEVAGIRDSFSYGGNLVEATRRAKAAALRAMASTVERGGETEADRLFSARGRLH